MLFSLIENLEKLDIVLASTSPRRYELLRSLGLAFKVQKCEVEEINDAHLAPFQIARENADRKGRWAAQRYPKALIIAADTIVSIGDHIMGKPKDEDDAFRMLGLLSGNTHQVTTAFGLFYQYHEQYLLDEVSTDVSFRTLSDDEIQAYINTGETFDKAGAYAIQGQGAVLIEGIHGCYFNVVGFPLARFYIKLEQFLSRLTI